MSSSRFPAFGVMRPSVPYTQHLPWPRVEPRRSGAEHTTSTTRNGRLAGVAVAPAPPPPREIRYDGVRLHVREWTGGDGGVLLIHGLASSSNIWDLVAP